MTVTEFGGFGGNRLVDKCELFIAAIRMILNTQQ
jgi:hypothetical protein